MKSLIQNILMQLFRDSDILPGLRTAVTASFSECASCTRVLIILGPTGGCFNHQKAQDPSLRISDSIHLKLRVSIYQTQTPTAYCIQAYQTVHCSRVIEVKT